MTEARNINGQEVIATERVPSNLSKRKDRPPVYFTSVVQHLLADESVIYGCTACDFTAEKPGQVRWHHSTEHRGKKMGNPGKRQETGPERLARFDPATTRVGPITTEEIEVEMEGFDELDEDDILTALEAALNGEADSEKVAKLELEVDQLKREVENLTAERDWWKDAAQKSTERLVRLRNALQGVLRGEK